MVTLRMILPFLSQMTLSPQAVYFTTWEGRISNTNQLAKKRHIKQVTVPLGQQSLSWIYKADILKVKTSPIIAGRLQHHAANLVLLVFLTAFL